MSLPLEALREVIADAVEYGLHRYDREHRRAEVAARAKQYLSEHPDASGNEVYRAVGKGCAKAWTLEAVRALRIAVLPTRGRSAPSSGVAPALPHAPDPAQPCAITARSRMWNQVA